jgi:hypothetical protein
MAHVATLLGRMSEGHDGETYKAELIDANNKVVTGYVKLSRDARKIIAELATAQVGRALGLRIPRPFVAILDRTDLRPDFDSGFSGEGSMVCYASEQAGRRSYSLERGLANPSQALKAALEKQFDLGTTIALDELVANDDRNLGNVIYSPAKQEFWLIDHGRAFTGTYWELWGLDDPAVSVRNLLADENAAVWDQAERKAIIDKARDLVNKCATLCLDDLDRDGYFEKIDASTDRLEIITFLRERINYTVHLLCNRLQMGHLSLTQPKPS